MSSLISSLLMAASLSVSSPAIAVQDPVSQADQKDLECIALFALMASDPAEQVSGSVGMVYYIGRLEGRNPGTDQVRRFYTWASTYTDAEIGAMIERSAPRCGQEMQALGNTMITVGREMSQGS